MQYVQKGNFEALELARGGLTLCREDLVYVYVCVHACVSVLVLVWV